MVSRRSASRLISETEVEYRSSSKAARSSSRAFPAMTAIGVRSSWETKPTNSSLATTARPKDGRVLAAPEANVEQRDNTQREDRGGDFGDREEEAAFTRGVDVVGKTRLFGPPQRSQLRPSLVHEILAEVALDSCLRRRFIASQAQVHRFRQIVQLVAHDGPEAGQQRACFGILAFALHDVIERGADVPPWRRHRAKGSGCPP